MINIPVYQWSMYEVYPHWSYTHFGGCIPDTMKLSYLYIASYSILTSSNPTQYQRSPPNVAVNCHSPMELRPQLPGKVTPTSSPIVNATLKWKNTQKKTYCPKCKTPWERKSPQWSQTRENYISKKQYISISKHHVSAWFMYVWLCCYKRHLIPMFKV